MLENIIAIFNICNSLIMSIYRFVLIFFTEGCNIVNKTISLVFRLLLFIIAT